MKFQPEDGLLFFVVFIPVLSPKNITSKQTTRAFFPSISLYHLPIDPQHTTNISYEYISK